MGVLQDIIVTLGGTAIGVTALTWLFRNILVHLLAKDIVHHKAALDSQNAIELERLRSIYAQQAIEHDVRFRRIDDKVTAHLEEVYRRLYKSLNAASGYVKVVTFADEPNLEQKHLAVKESCDAIWEHIMFNRIYIPPSLFKQSCEIASTLANIINEFARCRRREENGLLKEEMEEYWSKAVNDLNQRAMPLFNDIVANVQKRLAVEDMQL